MKFFILSEQEVRELIDVTEAFDVCREAFIKLASGQVIQPDVMSFDFDEQDGDAHAKGGYLYGTPYYSVKVAAGFYRNPLKGLPVMSGAVWVFDVTTGFLRAVLLENGFLTNLRTGAAGAIAADLLAREDVRQVAVLGCGSQGKFQLEALLGVRQIKRIVAYSRTPTTAQQFVNEMETKYGLSGTIASSGREALEGADLVITATPSRTPIVASEWIAAGTHITAVGSDLPEKQELDVKLLGRATVVADRLEQCVRQGEIHHALAAKTLCVEQVHAELGEIVSGMKRGRASLEEITIVDLTGVGALDAAVANVVAEKALEAGIGHAFDI
jgi:alanine dehydrogenase